jgi:hypothetical protein
MSAIHRTKEWAALSRLVRARTFLPAVCVGCGGIIQPGEPFDIGHILDAALYPDQALNAANVGPQHRGENRRAGGRQGARIVNQQRKRRATGEMLPW